MFHLDGRSSKKGGRCYDHNFLRFLPILGEKIGVGKNILKIITSVKVRKLACKIEKLIRTNSPKRPVGI
jgi:hypothetical protein